MQRVLLILSLLLSSKCFCWEMSLVHINDIHVRMEETNKYSAACSDKEAAGGKCYGGIARLQTAIKKLKSSDKNVLWLNAGDFYQGTVWYSHFKWRVVARFNNILGFHAMTLGNHEFDDGVKGLVPFLRNQTAPCVVSNIDIGDTPDMQGLCQPSVIVNIGDTRVGIIGYLTQETLEVSNPGKLRITDEIEAVTKESIKLHNQGIKIILGLGHSGYEKDIEIAENVPYIDAVIGGHTHSFLYPHKLKNPSNNIIEGPYPTIVTKKDGKKAAVVQAYAYTKYLGHLKMTFNSEGDLISWIGEPILLDSSIKEDEIVKQELLTWREELNKIGKNLVGYTDVELFNTREGESNIGNFVTDAMVWAYKANQERIVLAMINSGGIKASFNKGNITMENLLMSFPFRNTYDVVMIQGKYLRQAFEHSVANMNPDGSNEAGRFLQVSGFQLRYDITKPRGDRLVLVRVLDGDTGLYRDMVDTEVYSVIMTEFLAGGGDGYSVISENKLRQLQGPLDTDILQEYLKHVSPIQSELEDRIQIIDIHNRSFSKAGLHSISIILLILSILLLQIFSQEIQS